MATVMVKAITMAKMRAVTAITAAAMMAKL
jgi:hypothetical protein